MAIAQNLKRGAHAEIRVALELSNNGWSIFTPAVCDSSHPFDMIVTKRERMLRIQIKSVYTIQPGRHTYALGTYKRSSSDVYSNKECDFVVGAIIPMEWFFVLPVDDIDKKTIRVPLNMTDKFRYHAYNHAWHLLDR